MEEVRTLIVFCYRLLQQFAIMEWENVQCAGLLKWELAHLVTKIGTNLLSELSEL